MRLQWDVPPVELPYDPLLITCVEGLQETEHPYVFVARQAVKDLLVSDGAADKTIPLIPRVVLPLRMALMNSNAGVFQAGMETLK